VINIHERALKRIAPLMERVLTVDAEPASARALTGLLRDIAPCQVWRAGDVEQGLQVAETVNPHVIFVELDEAVDGLAFTRRLRRGYHACRRTPVIVCTATATLAAIVGARDAGAHEFLRKPFTGADLVRRIETVTQRKRDWVEAVTYVGPDRRRFNDGNYAGPLKRLADQPQTSIEARVMQALRIARSAAAAMDEDPRQALRALSAQASDLRAAGDAMGNPALTVAAEALAVTLALAGGEAPPASVLEAQLAELMTFMPGEVPAVSSAA